MPGWSNCWSNSFNMIVFKNYIKMWLYKNVICLIFIHYLISGLYLWFSAWELVIPYTTSTYALDVSLGVSYSDRFFLDPEFTSNWFGAPVICSYGTRNSTVTKQELGSQSMAQILSHGTQITEFKFWLSIY